jgi:tetratricopeptide (TPR) repeat protein
MGDLQAAEETLNQIPADQVNSAKWEEALAFIAWSKEDFEKATSHYRRAVSINPGSHVAHYNLAMMLAQSGNPEEAMIHAIKARDIAALPEYQQLIQQLEAE